MRFWVFLSLLLMNNLFALERSQQQIGNNTPNVAPAATLPKNDQSAAANRLVKKVIERNRILFGQPLKRK